MLALSLTPNAVALQRADGEAGCPLEVSGWALVDSQTLRLCKGRVTYSPYEPLADKRKKPESAPVLDKIQEA